MNILKFLVLLYDVYLQGINSLNAGAFVSLLSDFSLFQKRYQPCDNVNDRLKCMLTQTLAIYGILFPLMKCSP